MQTLVIGKIYSLKELTDAGLVDSHQMFANWYIFKRSGEESMQYLFTYAPEGHYMFDRKLPVHPVE